MVKVSAQCSMSLAYQAFSGMIYAATYGVNTSQDRMRRLWVNVLLQQLQDVATANKNDEAQLAKRQAIAWLTTCKADFYMVCDFAGINPHIAREALQVIFAQPNPGEYIRQLSGGHRINGKRTLPRR